VSLTKHGAHKIALLLAKFDKDQVLNHLEGSVAGINIERAQAKKNLSASNAGVVPGVWNKAKSKGQDSINALTLIAIIFSHIDLINAMKSAAGAEPFTGTIVRGRELDGKAFTNFAHTIEELGYSTEHSKNHVKYDLHPIFEVDGFNELAVELLELKLATARWSKTNSVIDELINLEFYKVFAVDEAKFRQWLMTGVLPAIDRVDDINFFTGDDQPAQTKPYQFVAGHRSKKVGTVKVAASKADIVATLLHNEIQNSLYSKLAKQYGADCVGTEVPTGQGTSIDLVVKTADSSSFYEIKTAYSAKTCIRQAIPQLLEYAYWDCRADKVDRLIIVGPAPATKEADAYLNFLRSQFSLEVYYEQFDTKQCP
jgi:hypothetical protein